MEDQPAPSPINPLPPVVAALALVLFGVECLFLLAEEGIIGGQRAVGWRQAALEDYAFFGELLRIQLSGAEVPTRIWLRLLSYPFVHLGFTHMLFAVVFLLALGNMVGRVFRAWAIALIFFASAAGGALLYGFYGITFGESVLLAGAFPAVYGLIGAYTFILWVSLAAIGGQQARAFTLIAMLMGIQLLFGLLFGTTNDWIADIGGFACGFALSFIVSPGGWARVLARLRQR
ncbi:MAG: rhomboid family intramembrane serine protease [Pseudomonadota bacterium]